MAMYSPFDISEAEDGTNIINILRFVSNAAPPPFPSNPPMLLRHPSLPAMIQAKKAWSSFDTTSSSTSPRLHEKVFTIGTVLLVLDYVRH
jgi:hypothetical protein